MKVRHKQYLLISVLSLVLSLVVLVTAYMTGCSDVYFATGERTIPCQDSSFAECNEVNSTEDEVEGFGALPKNRTYGTKSSEDSSTRSGDDPTATQPRSGDDPTATQPRSGQSYSRFDYEVTLGKALLVFIIDNSSSMHIEHESLAKQVPRLFNAIKRIPYRAGIITTDISHSPGNVSGKPYQDGNLIPFAISGQLILENKNLRGTPDKNDVTDFAQTIVRPETLKCDQSSSQADTRSCRTLVNMDNSPYDSVADCEAAQSRSSGDFGQCPSHDERAIYAANLFIEKYKNKIDKDEHIVFVVLSDEDERSGEEFIKDNPEYELEEKDKPKTLVEAVYTVLGPMQTFSWHSIIIPPGDTSCYNQQYAGGHDGPGTGRGYYGRQYARLSNREEDLRHRGNLLQGSVSSICNRNFASQLGKIKAFVEVPRIPIACDNPARVIFSMDEKRIRLDYTLNERALEFDSSDPLPLGSHIKVRAYCPN